MSTPGEHAVAVDEWTIVVPVKALAGAKSRLAAAVTASRRRDLVVAMATDVVRACVSTPGVSTVRVVSPDPEVEALALQIGAEFVREPAGESMAGRGDRSSDHDTLNAALAVAFSDVCGPVGVVTADLPEITAAHLGRILAAASLHPHSIIADRSGEGTTMAFWTGPAEGRAPMFGARSADRHRVEGGAVTLHGEASPAPATRDIDTPVDLDDLSHRPVGEATAVVLRHESAPGTRADGVSATMVP